MSKLLWQGQVPKIGDGATYRVCISKHLTVEVEIHSVDGMGEAAWLPATTFQYSPTVVMAQCILDMARIAGKL